MISLKKSLTLVVLCIVCSSSYVYSEPNGPPKRNLQFQISKEKAKLIGHNSPKATHMAILSLRTVPRQFKQLDLARPLLEQRVSKEQSSYMRQYNFVVAAIDTEEPDELRKVYIYGVSQKDVKITVETLIEWMDKEAHLNLEQLKKQLQEDRSRKSELASEIKDLHAKQKNLIPKIEDAKKHLWYRYQSDAYEVIKEFNKTLTLIEIDIIGIQAKLDMIKIQDKELAKPGANLPKGAADLLFQIRITQEIELTGASARKKAVMAAKDKASGFVDLLNKADTFGVYLAVKDDKLNRTQRRIEILEKELAYPPEKMRPVELVDNMVVIHPVKIE